jgi:hypothetical protein
MSLTKGSVNLFNVLDARRLNYIPTHFAKMTLNTNRIEMIDKWVYQNLDSRYAIVKGLKVDYDNKVVQIHEIGLEVAKELTIMSLSCPYLDKNV